MCIECDVEGDVARCMFSSQIYVKKRHDVGQRVLTDTLRSTGAQELGWMAMYVVVIMFPLSPRRDAHAPRRWAIVLSMQWLREPNAQQRNGDNVAVTR